MPEADDDLALLERAAREAGKVAMGFWRKSPKSWDKDDKSPVSEADMAVNATLEQVLGDARPGYGWLSEETPDTLSRLSRESLFVVDPIDGTRAFLDGHTHFAHSLAVVTGGAVRAAVVYLPAEDRLYAARADGTATCNGEPIAVSRRVALDGARVLTTRHALAAEHWRKGPPPVRREFRSSIAYRLCLVAEGRFDAMLTVRSAWEWDIAAGCLIVERAGGSVSDRFGRAPVFNSESGLIEGLIAGPEPLREAIFAALA